VVEDEAGDAGAALVHGDSDGVRQHRAAGHTDGGRPLRSGSISVQRRDEAKETAWAKSI
jgi:hypothetical protein